MNLQRRTVAIFSASLLLLGACAGPAGSPHAERPPIVFVHGNGDSAALWQSTLWRFESNGWPADRLHPIDLPYPLARDADNVPQAGRSSTAEHMAFLRDEVQAVLHRTGARQVVLVGNSRGGNAIRNFICNGGGASLVSHAILGGTPNHGVQAIPGLNEANEFSGTGPFLKQLNAPKIFAELALKPRGLVLVTGPTGSGKSTTLAAMVNHLNETEYGHILTVEDPIEFVHDSKRCLINQREVGPHTLSFSNALRSALREDPDCILVGEMRDLETIRLALTAAETGHLVFGTLHTSSAAKTIDRVIDVFPAEEKEMVRSMLSESLVAVISQTLCKLKDGSGRVAAHEIMLGTPAIRNLIRENKVAQMYSAIQTGGAFGMQTLDQCLADLVRRNIISSAEARSKAKMPENFPG